MTLTRLYPGEPETIDVDAAGTRERLRELYRVPATPWLRLNLIASVSGSASGSDGTSETLSNPVDRKLLGVIRELSNVVLIGAQSLRAEGYLLPRTIPLAVVTASGDLRGHGLQALEAGRLIVLCPASAADRARESLDGCDVDIITVPSSRESSGDPSTERLAMFDVVAALHARGFLSIVCEGGPGLAAQLVGDDLVDEACLSVSPVLNGSALPLFGAAEFAAKRLTLTQLLLDDSSALYSRWAISR